MRVLALLPDAFGGRGGIAKFNRDLLTALTQHPAITQVTALPRRIDEAAGALPRGLDYRTFAARGKAAFAAAMLGELARARRHDLVIAGHLNLLPLAAGVHLAGGGSLGLAIHGVEAWTPSERPFVAPALRRMSWFLAVSEYTKERFLRWAPVSPAQGIVVPNTVDTTLFSPGPRRADLLARYGLSGRTVVMTLARLDGRERCKGIDEVMEALRLLPAAIAYLVCGDGTDRARLEAKAAELGLADRVRFAGYVAESEKQDHYRLSGCFVLAGWCEGFGIALLEAQACGVPVVASTLDGSREAVIDQAAAIVVDPRNPASLAAAIAAALARPGGVVPAGVDRFSFLAFERALNQVISSEKSLTI